MICRNDAAERKIGRHLLPGFRALVISPARDDERQFLDLCGVREKWGLISMAIRNIVKEGDPVLSKTCRSVLDFDDRLATLIDDMVETMKEADGCGLAACQVGILRRVCVIDAGDGVVELVNPVIIEKEGEQEDVEGCLSCPGDYGVTRRPKKVTVRAQDRHGNTFTVSGEDLKARAFCHEIDHLDGIMFRSHVIRYLQK